MIVTEIILTFIVNDSDGKWINLWFHQVSFSKTFVLFSENRSYNTKATIWATDNDNGNNMKEWEMAGLDEVKTET